MKNIEVYNTLNIDKDSSSIVATFTQEDDAVMEFKLFKDGQEIVLKDQTISLGAERKDGAVIEQDDGFLIKENNVLNITLKKNIIQVVGVVKIQLYLKDKSGEMASNTFNIRVNKKLLGAENVEATNDIKSLNTLVLELKNNTNKLIDDTKSKADKLLSGLQETGDNLSSTVKAKTDKIIEDTKAEVDNIKKDYEGLKKVVIDENIGIKLQKDVTELQNGLKSNQALAYSGSSISAENTLEGRTEGMMIKGRTLKNVVQKRINLIPNLGSNTLKVDNYVTTYYSDIIEPNTEYYIIKNKKTDRIICAMVDTLEAESAIENLPVTDIAQDKVYKIRTTSKKILVCYIKTTLDESCKICIVKASSNYAEYFEGLKSFGEAEQEGDKYKISILSSSLSKIIFEQGTIDSSYGNDVYVNNRIKSNFIEGNFKSIKNTNLDFNKFMILLYTYDSSKRFIKTTTPEWVNYIDIEDIPSNTKYMRVLIKYKDDSNINVDIADSIYFGNKNKKYILLKEPLREGDTLFEDDGQVKVNREVGQYTFTGDEGWTLGTQSSGWGEFDDTLVFYLEPFKAKTNTKFICDRFAYIDVININNIGIYNNIWGGKPHPVIRIKKSELSSNNLEGFKAWLKANPTTVIYQLATPVTEIVENCVDIDLDTFQDKTYFNILNSMPGTLDFKIPSNLASIVQSHTKDIKIIYDLIDRLLIPNLIENKSDLALLSLK